MALDRLQAPALVVVDIQAGTLSNAVAISAPQIVERTAALADAFRTAGRPVAFVVSTGTAAGVTTYGAGGAVWPEGFDALESGLHRLDSEPLLRRAAWSAFAGTDLDERLGSAGVREVVIVGLATTFGVESTARSAADLGYDVIVVSDAVSDPDPSGHERSMTRVFPALGRVADSSEVRRALDETGSA